MEKDLGNGRAVVNEAPDGSSPQAASIPIAKIGITGTRWKLQDAQAKVLGGALIGFREGGVEWQLNGDCVGADDHAGKIWKAIGGKIQLHPPTNRSKRAFLKAEIIRTAKPYLDRNKDIVDECDVLVGLPQEEFEQQRSGTWSTIRYARKLGKQVMIIWPSGKMQFEPAKAIEAGTAKTERLGPQDESAVGNADLPNNSGL